MLHAAPVAAPVAAPTAATIAAPDAGSLKQRARLDALRLFLAHWRSSLIGVSFLTAVVALALHDHVSAPVLASWGALAGLNYIGQAVVSWQLERSPTLSAAAPRWLPWLHVSVVVSALVWGLLPWMVLAGGPPVLLLTCLFDLMLLFCVTNTPSTPGLVLGAVLPMVLAPLALLAHGGFISSD